MIKILIVEDNFDKSSKVQALILNEVKKGSVHVTAVKDIKSAKSLLYENKYDVIVLDLVLPFEEEDRDPKAEKGIQFLNDIYDNPSINKPIHIIGLTAFKDLKPQYEENFHKNLNHLIDYNADSFNWQDQLKNFLWRLIEKEKEFYQSRFGSTYNYDVAIITALEMELAAVRTLSPNWSSVHLENDSTEYIGTTFASSKGAIKVIVASTPQMGMNAAATLSMKMIHNFRPRYLILTGIAACTSLGEKYGYGDIIVADQSWDGGAGKITENEKNEQVFLPGANFLPLDSDIKEKIRAEITNGSLFASIRDAWVADKPNTIIQLHVGPVVSVAGVTENKAVVEELRKQNRKLIGLEMETYGVFYSANNCSKPKPIAISIKSISDFANTSKNDKYQSYAAYTSAQFAYHLITNKLSFDV